MKIGVLVIIYDLEIFLKHFLILNSISQFYWNGEFIQQLIPHVYTKSLWIPFHWRPVTQMARGWSIALNLAKN